MFGKGEEQVNLGGGVEDFLSTSQWGKTTEEYKKSWVNPMTC